MVGCPAAFGITLAGRRDANGDELLPHSIPACRSLRLASACGPRGRGLPDPASAADSATLDGAARGARAKPPRDAFGRLASATTENARPRERPLSGLARPCRLRISVGFPATGARSDRFARGLPGGAPAATAARAVVVAQVLAPRGDPGHAPAGRRLRLVFGKPRTAMISGASGKPPDPPRRAATTERPSTAWNPSRSRIRSACIGELSRRRTTLRPRGNRLARRTRMLRAAREARASRPAGSGRRARRGAPSTPPSGCRAARAPRRPAAGRGAAPCPGPRPCGRPAGS